VPDRTLEEKGDKTKATNSAGSGESGMVIPSLHGDLKMLVRTQSGVRLSVTFREYPKARREKTPSRAEAKRERSVVPLFARRKDQTREAVIETAGEGIYIFSAEAEHGAPATATFTLKIYEAGAREKTARIGRRSVSGKKVIAKVLMPEGILWDDDTAFTGSIEDSDSTTKFNSETGLYWKEYND